MARVGRPRKPKRDQVVTLRPCRVVVQVDAGLAAWIQDQVRAGGFTTRTAWLYRTLTELRKGVDVRGRHK
jgi:hypothetical protein